MKEVNRRKQNQARSKKDKPAKPIKKRRKNPAYTDPFLRDIDLKIDIALALGRLLRYFDGVLPKTTIPKIDECTACDGTCLCHHLGPVGGVSCPPDCKNHSATFDGCHKCDCVLTGGNIA